MTIEQDWSLNYGTKTITYTGAGPGTNRRYTCNELYSWLMDLFDDPGQMDDSVPISAQTPVEYSLVNGWSMASDSEYGYLYGGSINDTTNNDVWANFYTLGTIESDAYVYWLQNGTLVAPHPGYATSDWENSAGVSQGNFGHIDQLIKVVSAGTPIQTDSTDYAVAAFARNRALANADLYDHFVGTGTATGGRNPIPLATSADSNDDGSDVSGFTITIDFTGHTEDVDGDGTAEAYQCKVDCGGSYTVAQAYLYLKYVTRRENTSAIGTGDSTEGRFYRGISGNPEVKASPFGLLAGGTFFGARGILLTGVTDPNNRQLIDDAGNTRTPPTTVNIQVTGVAVDDYVFVARATGSVVDKSQFTLAGAHSSATTVTVNEVMTNSIPDSGILRLGDTKYTYTGIDRVAKQFTGVSPALTGANNDPLYNPYIDQVITAGTSISKSLIYDVGEGDFNVVARVRQKGILPFENNGDVTTSGATFPAIRTTDTVVT